ncbi:hypothetical protein B484DRAFT_230525 [Ochromonadaceae sp. CCMP2298]|nr:hypothetical protein B484DRAFT_230525 [Ochromonadaceae sp. CCMP2298]
MSHVLYPMSCVLYPTSYILYPMSYILYPMSYVLCTPTLSLSPSLTSTLFPSAEASTQPMSPCFTSQCRMGLTRTTHCIVLDVLGVLGALRWELVCFTDCVLQPF